MSDDQKKTTPPPPPPPPNPSGGDDFAQKLDTDTTKNMGFDKTDKEPIEKSGKK